jgi:hypothetical protein
VTLSAQVRTALAALLAAHTGNCGVLRGAVAGVQDVLAAMSMPEADRVWLTDVLSPYDQSCSQTHAIIDAIRAAVEG